MPAASKAPQSVALPDLISTPNQSTTTTTTTNKMSTHSYHNTEDRGEYESDTRWTAIDSYTMSHLHPSSRPSSAPIKAAAEYAADQGLDDIALPPAVGKFLALQCRMLGVKYALEVGTLGGYSAIWLLTENPQLRVTTCEYEPHHVEVARKNFENAGVLDRVEILQGAALDHLPRLLGEIESGKRERFGLTFIDADKENNWNYFDSAVKMSTPKACIVVDNVVSKGKLADPAAAETNGMVRGGRTVVENVGRDERVDGCVLQIVGEKDYDGFLMAAVK